MSSGVPREACRAFGSAGLATVCQGCVLHECIKAFTRGAYAQSLESCYVGKRGQAPAELIC